MRILVLDGNENHAVAAVRSLGQAGHNVLVGAASAWSKAGWSRAAQGTFVYPAPQTDALKFVASIKEKVAPDTLVMPMTERTTLPLSEHREAIFAQGGKLVLPSHETVEKAFDKKYTTTLAERLGIQVPRTWHVEISAAKATDKEAHTKEAHTKEAQVTLNELEAAFERILGEVVFPVVIKPRSSEEIAVDGAVKTTGAPVYARDASELKRAMKDVGQRAASMLIQEFVEGTGAGYFALMRHGDLRLEFAHRRIRDVRPSGSGSAVRASVRPEARVRAASLKILEAMKWHGVAMVEFRIRADGTPVFLEVNGRFWNSLPLAIYAGADFPKLLAEIAEFGDTRVALASTDDVLPIYRDGVKCRWILGDVRHLAAVWRGAPSGYTGKFPARLQTLADFIKPTAGMYHDNFQWRDPLPEAGDWLDFLLRRVPQALGKNRKRES